MLASPTSVMFLGYSRSCSPPIGSQPTLNHADLRCRKRVEPLAYEPLRNLCWFLPWGVPGSFLSGLREIRGGSNHRTQTKHQDAGKRMETGTSETRVFDGIENFYKRGRIWRFAHGLREFLAIGLGHLKFRSSITFNCKSITEVLNILGFLMRLPWEGCVCQPRRNFDFDDIGGRHYRSWSKFGIKQIQ